MRSASVVVVGAGIGGLVAAVELARRGIRVTVLEKSAGPGGKMRREEIAGLSFDAGPTVLTMLSVFEDIFAGAGSRVEDHLELEELDVLARHWWPDGSQLDLYRDIERSADAIGQFAGSEEAKSYRRFRRAAKDIYETLERTFIRATRPSLPGLIGRVGILDLPRLIRIQPYKTMWDELGKYFRDPRLRQLFGRYATYCGSSPFQAPATMMLVAHVEAEGVWRVVGGMNRLAQALAVLASAHGADFRYDAQVVRIEARDHRVQRVQLESGEAISTDAVVWNGDASAVAGLLAGPSQRVAPRAMAFSQRSLSAVTWTGLGSAGPVDLSHHNVFFSPDYRSEFKDIIRDGRPANTPTIYVCAQDRTADGPRPSVPPDVTERLMCLVNAPANADSERCQMWETETCLDRAFGRLGKLGIRLSPMQGESLLRTPLQYSLMFPATGGALYGKASHGWMASFQRPRQRTRIANLYLAGGSTHPGPGVPMAALSGRLAAQAIVSDLISA